MAGSVTTQRDHRWGAAYGGCGAGAVKAFADAGLSELNLDPTVSALDQMDRMADVVR